MATTIESLFGVTPEALQAQREANLQAQALRFAQLNPSQRIQMGAFMAGNRLAEGIGGLLGAKDPELERIQQRQEMLKGVDPNSPSSLREKAADALARNDFSAASLLTQRAAEVEKAQAELASTQALTAQRMRERAAADPLQQLLRSGQYTPESVQAYSISGNPASLVLAKEANTKDWKVNEVGIDPTTGSAVFTITEPGKAPYQAVQTKDAEGKPVWTPHFGRVDRTTAKVTATASTKGAEAGAEEAAKLDARSVSDARALGNKALEQAGVLQELLKTPQGVVGTGANARVAALRVFSTVGLTSPKDNEALQNADRFNALAGERVLSFIKSLGTNPTDTDREFARTIGPALEKGEKSNRDLVSYLMKRAEQVVSEANNMSDYFYNNNYSLKGYRSSLTRNLQLPQASTRSPEDLARIAGGRIVDGKFVKDAK